MMYKLKRFAKTRLRGMPRLYSGVQNIYLRLKAARYSISKSSVFNDADQLQYCSLFPQDVLDLVIAHYHPASVLDVGCGTGKSLDYFMACGVDAWGLEGSALAIEKAVHPERIQRINLNEPVSLLRKFDLVWSYEVAEHIHPSFVEALMTTITTHADHVVISAARPGQGGDGHFNEQPPEYWIEKFRQRSFKVNQAVTAAAHSCKTDYCENIMVFDRETASEAG